VRRTLSWLYLLVIGVVGVLFIVEAWGTPPNLDTVIAILIVFGPWKAGGVLGWLWGRTRLGVIGAIALGVVLTVAGLAAFLFLEGTSQNSACGEDECFHAFGHWIEASLAVQWPIYAVIAWAFSASRSVAP
jgi:hypothetical protein